MLMLARLVGLASVLATCSGCAAVLKELLAFEPGMNQYATGWGPLETQVAYPSDPADAAVVASNSGAVWRQTGWLADIPVIESCRGTGGDIAVARMTTPYDRVIIYCQRQVDRTNAMHPGAGHFYFVHEFAHHALSSNDERECDAWAARQLTAIPDGDAFLRQAMRHFMSRGQEYHPNYGTMWSRAENISWASGVPMPTGY